MSPFVDELMRFIAKFRAKDGSELEIEMAAQEALANAIVHGNQMDLEKRVYVTCGCALDGEVNLTIRDEGQGFKPDCVAGPHAPENHLRISGRGIHLMKTFMDEVLFEQGGSVVQYAQESPAAPQASAWVEINLEEFVVAGKSISRASRNSFERRLIVMLAMRELKEVKIFSCLGEQDLQWLSEQIADLHLEPGEYLIHEGEPTSFFVLLEGVAEVTKEVMGRRTEVSLHSAGDFFGELAILMATSAPASVRAKTNCRFGRLDPQDLQELIRRSAECSALIMQTLNERVQMVQKYMLQLPSSRVKIIASKFDDSCRDIRTFLSTNQIPYQWTDSARSRQSGRRTGITWLCDSFDHRRRRAYGQRYPNRAEGG